MQISDKIWQQYGVKHTRILQHELAQRVSKMSPYISVMPGCKGKSVEIPFIGGVKSKERTQRYEEIERDEPVFGNRHMRARMRYIATPISSDDPLFNTNLDYNLGNITSEHQARINIDRDLVILGVKEDMDSTSPTFGKYIKLTAAAAPTSVYDAGAGGILGTNYTGQTGAQLEDLGDTDTGNDLTTNVVPYDFKYSGTKAGTGMMLDKIVRAIELLKKRHAFVKGENTAVLALTSRQIAEIQMWESAQNKNYGFGDLVDGFKNRILGVNILETEMLPHINVAAANQPVKLAQICPMWVKEHMVFGLWDNAKVRVDPHLPDYVDMGQVVTTYAFGAARKHPGSVIQIQCLDTLAS